MRETTVRHTGTTFFSFRAFLGGCAREFSSDELEENLALANSAMEEVKKKLTYGASNKPESTEFTKKRLRFSRFCYQLPRQLFYGGFGFSNPGQFYHTKISAQSLELFGVGNCGEQSALAFIYLSDKKKITVERMHIKKNDHAFVVIGRNKNSGISDYRNWGPNAVVCDPWADSSYPATEIEKNLGSLYRVNFNPQTQRIARMCYKTEKKYSTSGLIFIMELTALHYVIALLILGYSSLFFEKCFKNKIATQVFLALFEPLIILKKNNCRYICRLL